MRAGTAAACGAHENKDIRGEAGQGNCRLYRRESAQVADADLRLLQARPNRGAPLS